MTGIGIFGAGVAEPDDQADFVTHSCMLVIANYPAQGRYALCGKSQEAAWAASLL